MQTIIHHENSKEFILDANGSETRVGDEILWGWGEDVDNVLFVSELFINENQIGANNEEGTNYVTAFAETFYKTISTATA